MKHRLKTLPEYFGEVASGRKSFEVRKNDREPPFAPGDTLLLEEYIEGKYSGRWIQADVTLVLQNEYCKEGYCVMAVVPTGGNGLRPPTNADRIRAMSNEELAVFLEKIHDETLCVVCNNVSQCLRNNAPEPICKNHVLDWLAQPAEEAVARWLHSWHQQVKRRWRSRGSALRRL